LRKKFKAIYTRWALASLNLAYINNFLVPAIRNCADYEVKVSVWKSLLRRRRSS